VGIIDGENRVLYKQRHRNDVPSLLRVLDPFKKDLRGVVVESTYNWYWLVDGLPHERGLPGANPSAIKQYEGLKTVDDKRSSLWLANLILPTGYIYPKEERPLRDLLRKRLQLVHHRTAHILSVKNVFARSLTLRMKSEEIKKLDCLQVKHLFPEEICHAIMASVGLIGHLQKEINGIEKMIRDKLKLKREFTGLLTMPGIGEIIAMTIMVEVGNINRFPTVQDYSSYCRCVKSTRTSNGKVTGYGNRKNGNKYLSWAYIEAAQFAKRYHETARNFYEKKMTKTNKIVAIKALSHKLARASYFIMRDGVEYNQARLF